MKWATKRKKNGAWINEESDRPSDPPRSAPKLNGRHYRRGNCMLRDSGLVFFGLTSFMASQVCGIHIFPLGPSRLARSRAPLRATKEREKVSKREKKWNKNEGNQRDRNRASRVHRNSFCGLWLSYIKIINDCGMLRSLNCQPPARGRKLRGCHRARPNNEHVKIARKTKEREREKGPH